ncbi:hypothetical protein OGCDGJMD_02076 [Cyanobium usitatum str. Tous]|jgi:hypothetical protein|nr:hypothetical protein OGCDGJMD_02076 [Cyanobium usitatum str. Tous]
MVDALMGFLGSVLLGCRRSQLTSSIPTECMRSR